MRPISVAILAGILLLMVGAPSSTRAAAPLTLSARLTGSAEVPPVSGAARGRAVVVINAERTELQYRITYQGLSGPLRTAAFCIGWSTTDVVCPFIGPELPVGPSPLVGTRPIIGIQAENWTSGQAWVQLLTDKYPQGEIRGLLTTLPATSTILNGQGTLSDVQIAVILLAGALGAWAFLRRLERRPRWR